MSPPRPSEISQILERIREGDAEAAERLYPMVYDELRRIARMQMARENPGQTLQPTALVHEAYLRLLGDQVPDWQNRAHFFTAAAEAMRRILIERARRKARLKRGGHRRRVDLDSHLGKAEPPPEEVLALDEALGRLEELDPGMAEVVKLRFFAGLTVEETAGALATSPRTVNRRWTAARAWLIHEMSS